MPGGGLDKVFCLDMAHMDLRHITISPSCSPPDSPKAAAADADAGADISISSAKHKAGGAGSGTATPIFAGLGAGDGSINEDRLEGTQHSTSSLARAASVGDRSTHLTTVAGAPEVLSTGRFKKTLNLKEGKNGMLVGQYILEPADAATSPSSSVHGGSVLGRGSNTSWLGSIGVGSAAQQARSVHAGNAFFNKAATGSGAAARDRSTSRAGRGAAAVSAANKTVHGGTAHAATKQSAQGGIFYEG
jgi:hypothetical protein